MAKKKNVRTYQRGKTWTFCFETKKVVGKRKPYTKGGFPTEEEAYKAGMAALADYVNGQTLAKEINISFGDFLLKWLENNYKHDVKEITYTSIYALTKKHIIPVIGNIALTDLSHINIKSFLAKKTDEGYSKATLQQLKGIITKALTAAIVEYNYISTNPAREVAIPKAGSRRVARKRIPITKAEQKTLLKACSDNRNLYTAVMIGLHCGLRIGETFALTWDDIDFDKKTIDINKQISYANHRMYVDAPKYNSVRVICIDDALIRALNKLKAEYLEEKLKCVDYPDKLLYEDDRADGALKKFDFIFRKTNGALYSRNLGTTHLKELKDELKMDVDFHTLRHTHCTDLISCGAPLKAVQQRMGHKNIDITMNIYTSVSKDMDDQVKSLLNTALYAN